jgi:hypothetical protein
MSWFVPPEIFVAAILPVRFPKNQQIPTFYVPQQFGTGLNRKKTGKLSEA